MQVLPHHDPRAGDLVVLGLRELHLELQEARTQRLTRDEATAAAGVVPVEHLAQPRFLRAVGLRVSSSESSCQGAIRYQHTLHVSPGCENRAT